MVAPAWVEGKGSAPWGGTRLGPGELAPASAPRPLAGPGVATRRELGGRASCRAGNPAPQAPPGIEEAEGGAPPHSTSKTASGAPGPPEGKGARAEVIALALCPAGDEGV